MIQRVQSVYLLLVTVLMSIFLVKSWAEIILDNNQVIDFYTYAIQTNQNGGPTETVSNTLPLLILVIATGFISFFNIFLFQKRILQIRVSVLSSVLLIGQLILIFFYYTGTKADVEFLNSSLKLPVVFPVVSIILNFMAYRAIHHDDTLVKSYDRIR